MNFSGGVAVIERGTALLEAAEANLRARRSAGAEQLEIAREWAFSHRRTMRAPGDDDRDTRRIGASDFPVYEYAAVELGVAWEIHPLAAQRLMADAVDLEARLPQTWAAVRALRLESWVARKIVSLTRDLTYDQAQLVDEQIADRLGELPAGRLLTLVEARVVAADKEAAEEKWRQAASERTVHLGRETDYGTRNVFARLDAADAIKLKQSVDLLAEQLTPLDDETADQRRARALGVLADPQAALAVLDGRDPRGGKAVVYVHTTPEQLKSGDGVARVEDLGPFTKRMMQDLLARAQITVKPVIDLNEEPAADCYEIPAAIAERVHLMQPADVYPFAESTSRWLDYDHNLAFRDTGPPGQTRPGNLGKLNRRHHRAKTFASGLKLERISLTSFRWTTPLGRQVIVDRDGTHPLKEPASYPLDVRFAA